MRLFNKKSRWIPTTGQLNPLCRDEGDVIVETIKIFTEMFTDVEIEGRKRGYERASAEYEPAYKKIKKEYDETKKALEKIMEEEDKQADKLFALLKQLEGKEADLEKKIQNKAKKVSAQFNIPLSSVTASMTTGIIGGTDWYNYKKRKLRAAEEKGYAEAKEIYENKINELKENLGKLKKKGNLEIQKMMNLINDVINEIIEKETQIAKLEIVLNS